MSSLFSRSILALVAVALLCGCEPAATHRFLTTFFDEVPALPPVEQYCEEVLEQKAARAESGKGATAQAPVYQPSIHPPYAEKRCNGCHEAEKTTISGLLKPETELCFMCHPNILKHRYAHGPAAEGECLGCHLPHEGSYPSLLARDPLKLCQKCHSEERSAAGMHDKIQAKGVRCIDCHDPHSGDSRYFLK
ncbi:cytochrome c3 family protein [Geomonas azotofigens]|uniref:cytochrome c3 family protein n=1 Tax=Geomonas azotofigens TaxID=2843196 RepID=UPI001C10F7D6|nr:cytochrome c3 family protein [Geomonas azotofigens]MBU5614525.1 cytochrome c3 family protein [Geomonas azotofigens]